MISRSVGSSSTSGSVLTARSLDPASDSVSPSLSAPLLLALCLTLSKINIKFKKKKKGISVTVAMQVSLRTTAGGTVWSASKQRGQDGHEIALVTAASAARGPSIRALGSDTFPIDSTCPVVRGSESFPTEEEGLRLQSRQKLRTPKETEYLKRLKHVLS